MAMFLNARSWSVTSVTTAYPGATAGTLLAAELLRGAPRGGSNCFPVACFGNHDQEIVTVTYVPIDDRGIRKQVLRELLAHRRRSPSPARVVRVSELRLFD